MTDKEMMTTPTTDRIPQKAVDRIYEAHGRGYRNGVLAARSAVHHAFVTSPKFDEARKRVYALLDAILPATADHQASAPGGDVEAFAKVIYEAMQWAGRQKGNLATIPDWVERGNSLGQEEARRFARKLRTQSAPQQAEPVALQTLRAIQHYAATHDSNFHVRHIADMALQGLRRPDAEPAHADDCAWNKPRRAIQRRCTCGAFDGATHESVTREADRGEFYEPTEREPAVDRYGMIDPASGHDPLYFGRTNDVKPYAISGPEYVLLSDYEALRVASAYVVPLPQRPKPEWPAGNPYRPSDAYDAYSGVQMLEYGRACVEAALSANTATTEGER